MSHSIDPGLNVVADLQMVKTILRNLISNAIKYTNDNGEITITGLGLLLCKEFVELHGGNIRLESEPDKGTRFAFTLPHYI